MKRKSVAFILLLSVMLVFFSSCNAKKDDDQKDNQNNNTFEETTMVATTPAATEPPFPDENYEGFEFRILARDNNWDKMEVDFDEPQAEVVYNAVYQRNLAVEEKYNVKVTGVKTTGDIYQKVKDSYKAGDNAYDMVLTSMVDSARLGQEGFLRNWNGMPGINLSNSWWDQHIIKDLSIDNNIFFMTGELNIRDNDNIWCILFNKQLIKDLQLESPYKYVTNGNWTFDKMYEMGKSAVKNMDGDGTYTEADRYGLITTFEGAKNFFYASGLKVVDKDADGNLQIVLNNNKTQSVLNKINDIFSTDNMTYFKAPSWEKAEELFASGMSLFYGEIVTHVINLRYMATDFGILPTPKFDEEQEAYYTHIASNGTAVSIPNILPNEERTGNIIEALGYYGQKYLTPAFNDVSLQTKHARDNESADMLNIIWKSVRYDIGYLFNIGGMADITTSLVSKNQPDTFQSTYEKQLGRAEKDIAALIEAYDSLGR